MALRVVVFTLFAKLKGLAKMTPHQRLWSKQETFSQLICKLKTVSQARVVVKKIVNGVNELNSTSLKLLFNNHRAVNLYS